MGETINKTEYKFLKYKAEFEPRFITLSNKFKIPKNELFGAMVIYFDKTNRDPRELNFDNSMERVIKILNKNERDYFKPIYNYLLDGAIQNDETFKLLNDFLSASKEGFRKDEKNENFGEEKELKSYGLEAKVQDQISQLFLSFANDVAKANEFERREIYLNYKSKIFQLF